MIKKVWGEVGSSLLFSYIKDMKETKDQTTYFKKSQLCHDLYGRQDDLMDVFINAPYIIHNDEILIPVPYALELFAKSIIYQNGHTDNGKSISELWEEDSKLDRIIL